MKTRLFKNVDDLNALSIPFFLQSIVKQPQNVCKFFKRVLFIFQLRLLYAPDFRDLKSI